MLLQVTYIVNSCRARDDNLLELLKWEMHCCRKRLKMRNANWLER